MMNRLCEFDGWVCVELVPDAWAQVAAMNDFLACSTRDKVMLCQRALVHAPHFAITEPNILAWGWGA